MGIKKYIVRLTAEERGRLRGLVSKGRASARKMGHARVLLKVDADGPNWTDEKAAEAMQFGPTRYEISGNDSSSKGSMVHWSESAAKSRPHRGSSMALARHG